MSIEQQLWIIPIVCILYYVVLYILEDMEVIV
jgi:hypothetical protein